MLYLEKSNGNYHITPYAPSSAVRFSLSDSVIECASNCYCEVNEESLQSLAKRLKDKVIKAKTVQMMSKLDHLIFLIENELY